MDSLIRRRERQQRNRRISAAVLALIVAFVSLAGLTRAFRGGERPASEPPSKDIFADVHGWIAYGDDEGIWAVDPSNPSDPGDRVRLSTVGGEPLAWSSDGSKLLIRRRGIGDSFDDNGLFVLDADGTETRLTGSGRLVSGGSFTPDGAKVIYAGVRPGNPPQAGIYVVDADGGTSRLLLSDSDDEAFPILFLPTFSPDGKKTAYVDGSFDSDYRLWVMDADGSDPRLLLDKEMPQDALSWILHLVWSPDGSRLAFDYVVTDEREEEGPRIRLSLDYVQSLILARGEEPRSDIYVLNVNGSGLTRAIPGASNPHWSPDGSRISFTNGVTAQVPPEGSLAIAAPDGSDAQEFDHSGSGPWNPLIPSVPDDLEPTATEGASRAAPFASLIVVLGIVGIVALVRRAKSQNASDIIPRV